MNIIIDARALQMYPVGKPGFHGGTELLVKKLAVGLGRNHTVSVVTPDLEREEYRDGVWWWAPEGHPTHADVVVAMHNLSTIEPYSAPLLILQTNGIDPWLGPEHSMAEGVDAFPCFSQTHIDLLCQARQTVDKTKCFVTGLGVDLSEYIAGYDIHDGHAVPKPILPVPGRMLYANDPARGLWHTLDIFQYVKQQVPEATLHVAYDFDRQFESQKWLADYHAEMLWECKARMETQDGVTNIGALSREDLIREQLECHVHAMSSDPPNTGSQIHGILQLEMAAAGTPLVLSDIEAFPEVFGEAALCLPVPGTFLPQLERRYDAQDWAEAVVQLMKDEAKWQEASRKARALAEQHTWGRVVENWEAMLAKLQEGVALVA